MLKNQGNFLVVQCLGPHHFNTESLGSNTHWGTKNSQTTQHHPLPQKEKTQKFNYLFTHTV